MSARPRAGSQGSLEEPDDEVMPYSDDETDEELQSEDDLDRAEDQLPEPEPRPAPVPGEMKTARSACWKTLVLCSDLVSLFSFSSQRPVGPSERMTGNTARDPSFRRRFFCASRKADTR